MFAGVTPLTDTTRCRLCEGPTTAAFQKLILNRYSVQYLECGQCGSLQTEKPYWLDESYAGGNLATLDTGAAQRVLSNWALTYTTARLLGARLLLDYGGGDGLLCRLLRDVGLDAYRSDRFAKATYGIGFDSFPGEKAPDLMTAFEVVEHFANPVEDLATLLSTRPTSFLGTTGLYRRQGENWWYLTPETGQHVFFYSPQALKLAAEKFGYSLHIRGDVFLFTTIPLTSRQRMMLNMAFSPRVRKLLRCLSPLLATPGIESDYRLARQRISSSGGGSKSASMDAPSS